MTIRTLMLSLLATTALTSFAAGQTAPQAPGGQPAAPNAVPAAPAAPVAPAAPAAAKPSLPPAPAANAKPASQPSAPKQAAPAGSFGTVVATEPPKPQAAPVLTQPGFTSSPTDFANVADRARAQQATGATVTTGGTTPVAGSVGGIGSNPRPVSTGGVTGSDLGGGYLINEEAKKDRSTVTRDAIDKQSPTANPYQLVNLLPGVFVQSTDNTGLNGGNIHIRGFNNDHIGLTIEGAPVNDSGNYALFPQEYVDAENIQQVSLAQGYQDLDSPHIGSTGGVLNIYISDPAKTPGGIADFSVGSNNLKREFVRVDTGQIGAVRAFLSYSNLTKDNWQGVGSDNRNHVDFKQVWDVSPGNTIRFSAIYNDAINNNYINPTLAQFTSGLKPKLLSNLSPSFFSQIAPINQTGGTGLAANSFYEHYRINPFRNLILSAPSNFTITKDLKFDTIPYYWYGSGNGGGIAVLNEAGFYNGNLKITNNDLNGNGKTADRIALYNPSITNTDRPGVINKFTYNMGDHQFLFGDWFEYARHRQTAPYEKLDGNGNVIDPFATGANLTYANATCTTFNPVTGKTGAVVSCPTTPLERRDQLTQTTTNAVFAGDSWKATNSLSMDFGVKQVFVHRGVDNYLPGYTNSNSLNDSATLYYGGISYKLDKSNKIFASYGESFHTAPNFSLIQSVSNSTGALTPAFSPPPEKGQVVEVGHRYQGSLFSTSLTGFYGYYTDYQISTNVADPSGSGSQVSLLIDAGRLQNYGIDGEIGTRPIFNFRPYVSAELLHTEFLDNFRTASTKAGVNDFLKTAGKELPAAPSFQYAIGIDYDEGHWFGNLAYKYQGPSYSTLINDEQIKGYGRLDGAVGYRFSNIGFLKQPEIKLNVYNMLDARQLTGVNSITNNAQNQVGVNGNTIAGSTPNYYQGQGASGLLTFRTGF